MKKKSITIEGLEYLETLESYQKKPSELYISYLNHLYLGSIEKDFIQLSEVKEDLEKELKINKEKSKNEKDTIKQKGFIKKIEKINQEQQILNKTYKHLEEEIKENKKKKKKDEKDLSEEKKLKKKATELKLINKFNNLPKLTKGNKLMLLFLYNEYIDGKQIDTLFRKKYKSTDENFRLPHNINSFLSKYVKKDILNDERKDDYKSDSNKGEHRWSLRTDFEGFQTVCYYYSNLGFPSFFLKSPYIETNYKKHCLKLKEILNSHGIKSPDDIFVLFLCFRSTKCLDLLLSHSLGITLDTQGDLEFSVENLFVMTFLTDLNRLKESEKYVKRLQPKFTYNKHIIMRGDIKK